MSAPDSATEIVADVAEEVAEQATHVAEVSRGLSGRDIGLVFGGLVVGAAGGGALGYIFAKRVLEEKYNQIAAEEIAEMREHYHAKEVARDNAEEKGNLEDIVKERGYVPDDDDEEEGEETDAESATPPMAVTPPSAVVERAEEVRDEEAETPPPPEEDPEPEPEVRNIFRDNQPPPDEWDWAKERAQRSPLKPYVIHRDEREEHDAYDSVTYTYYEADDVVCNERDEVIDAEDRERIFGEANLEKFGHGSDDATIVYVRNNKLEMDIEIVRSPNSFAQEVHGFEPEDKELKHSDRRRGRTPFDDER
jgi:hypothetical protein